MNVSSARIVSFLAMLGAQGVCALPAAAQNMSFGLAETSGISQGITQGRTPPLDARHQSLTGKLPILDQYALQEIAGPETERQSTEPLSNVSTTAQDEFVIASQANPAPQGVESLPDHGVPLSLLKQSTIGNLLISLKKKYDPKSMTEAGNLYWFFDSQHDLATGSKSKQLLACTRMLRSWGVCASTNARTFSVYIRNL